MTRIVATLVVFVMLPLNIVWCWVQVVAMLTLRAAGSLIDIWTDV